MKYPLILGELVKVSNLYDNNLYNCKNTHLIVKNGHLKRIDRLKIAAGLMTAMAAYIS